MIFVNPLLDAVSNIKEIRQFNDYLEKNISTTLFLTSSTIISYFIGAIAIKKKVVVISDDAFSLYHESAGVKSVRSQYLPSALSDKVFPSEFSVSKSKYIQTLASSLAIEGPRVIFTEGDLGEHVPGSVLSEKDDRRLLRVNDQASIGNILKTLEGYGYDENIQTKIQVWHKLRHEIIIKY